MKISGANLLAKVPVFFKNNKKAHQVFLLLLIFCLLIIVYVYFYYVNNIKMQYIRTDINTMLNENQLDSCSINFIIDYSGNTRLNSYLDKNKGYNIHLHYNIDSIQERGMRNLIYEDSLIKNVYDKLDVYTEISSLLPNFFFHSTATKDGIERNSDYTTITPKTKIGKHKELDSKIYARSYHKLFTKNSVDSLKNWTRLSYKLTHFEKASFISFKNLSVCCLKMIIKGPIPTNNTTVSFNFLSPMAFSTIEPEPDYLYASGISYKNEEKIKQILAGGIFLYGESIANKGLNESRNFILATIIGFLFSVAVTQLYVLFKKD